MRTIVLATQKGGSGKSTLAIGLAVAAMASGQRVALIEADQQETVSNWGRRRTLPEPRIERVGSSTEIERALVVLRRSGCTLAVIDTPATDNALSASAIAAADICLIPARPSPADIEAALPTLATGSNSPEVTALVTTVRGQVSQLEQAFKARIQVIEGIRIDY